MKRDVEIIFVAIYLEIITSSALVTLNRHVYSVSKRKHSETFLMLINDRPRWESNPSSQSEEVEVEKMIHRKLLFTIEWVTKNQDE